MLRFDLYKRTQEYEKCISFQILCYNNIMANNFQRHFRLLKNATFLARTNKTLRCYFEHNFASKRNNKSCVKNLKNKTKQQRLFVTDTAFRVHFGCILGAILAPYKEVGHYHAGLALMSFPSYPFLPFLVVLTSPSIPRRPFITRLTVLSSPSFPCCSFLPVLAVLSSPSFLRCPFFPLARISFLAVLSSLYFPFLPLFAYGPLFISSLEYSGLQ